MKHKLSHYFQSIIAAKIYLVSNLFEIMKPLCECCRIPAGMNAFAIFSMLYKSRPVGYYPSVQCAILEHCLKSFISAFSGCF